MRATNSTADLPTVTTSEQRGEAIRTWRAGLPGKPSVREMEERSGIPRASWSNAEHGVASPGIFQRIELWISQQSGGAEGRTAMREIGEPEDRLMEVEVRGRGGFRIIVRAPVDDPEALADMVERLMDRGMSTPDNGDETDRSATSE